MNHFFLIFTISITARSGTEGMKQMPLLKEKKIITVVGNEDFESQKDFGNQEPAIKMKNLMMVGGSGMEEMSMEEMTAHSNHNPSNSHSHSAHSEQSEQYSIFIKKPERLIVGTNLIEFNIKDQKTGKAASKIKLKSEVYMTSMDMGTEYPIAKEKAEGVYLIKAPFSMKGPWAIKLIFPNGDSRIFDLYVK